MQMNEDERQRTGVLNKGQKVTFKVEIFGKHYNHFESDNPLDRDFISKLKVIG